MTAREESRKIKSKNSHYKGSAKEDPELNNEDFEKLRQSIMTTSNFFQKKSSKTDKPTNSRSVSAGISRKVKISPSSKIQFKSKLA